MSKWLNVRLANDPIPKHELFGTEREAEFALEQALQRQIERGCHVETETVGGETRWTVLSSGDFVARYWLSDTGCNETE